MVTLGVAASSGFWGFRGPRSSAAYCRLFSAMLLGNLATREMRAFSAKPSRS